MSHHAQTARRLLACRSRAGRSVASCAQSGAPSGWSFPRVVLGHRVRDNSEPLLKKADFCAYVGGRRGGGDDGAVPIREGQSGYRGVCWSVSNQKYYAAINVKGRAIRKSGLSTPWRRQPRPMRGPISDSMAGHLLLASRSSSDSRRKKATRRLTWSRSGPRGAVQATEACTGMSATRSTTLQSVNGTLQYLGLFDTAEEAARAYARAHLSARKERRRRLTWSRFDQGAAVQATEACAGVSATRSTKLKSR